MPKFKWVATTSSGQQKKGVMDAPTSDAVTARLRSDDMSPVSVKKAQSLGEISFGNAVAHKDILIFTRQLSTMIDAGLPLVQCIDIQAAQVENKAFANILEDVKLQIETGSTFSAALAKHPKVFDALYVNLVGAGEVGGILDTILTRLAVYIEKAVQLKRQVKSALVYPISVLVIAAGVIAIMLGKVIPTFEEMYEEFDGASLPKPTQVVIDISHAFIDRWYIFVGIIVGLVVGMPIMLRNEKGRMVFDRLLLKVPVIGPVMRKIAVARFTRTLGTLLSSGVPILEAMEICARTSGNTVIEAAIMFTRDRISEGKDMAGPLMQTDVFPSMVVQMIGVGEQTGAVDQMLQKIADFYEEEVDVAVTAMTALMEPMMMAFLGTVVGGLIIAMYLPIFDIAGNVTAS